MEAVRASNQEVVVYRDINGDEINDRITIKGTFEPKTEFDIQVEFGVRESAKLDQITYKKLSEVPYITVKPEPVGRGHFVPLGETGSGCGINMTISHQFAAVSPSPYMEIGIFLYETCPTQSQPSFYKPEFLRADGFRIFFPEKP